MLEYSWILAVLALPASKLWIMANNFFFIWAAVLKMEIPLNYILTDSTPTIQLAPNTGTRGSMPSKAKRYKNVNM